MPKPSEKPVLLRLLQDISSVTGHVPRQYWLDGVILRRSERISSGGEAIIFEGLLHQRRVAVREIFCPLNEGWKSSVGRETIKVSIASFSTSWFG